MKAWLDKVGSTGAIVAAAACPVCFPKLALIGALFGFGALGAYESQLFLASQLLVLLAVLGHGLSYRRHRDGWVLVAAIASGAAVFVGVYAAKSELLAYAGFAGLLAASTLGLRRRHRPATPQFESTITCPQCGTRQKERMPDDACQFFYECRGCSTILRPKPGDCCVFCSYGSVKCPPLQLQGERREATT